MKTEQLHPIKVVARRTGLSQHVIRIWEKRYDAVVPQRTETNRRMYTEEDVQRLMLLKTVTDLGHSIGQVAELSDKNLRQMINTTESDIQTTPVKQPATGSSDQTKTLSYLAACIAALENLNAAEFNSALNRAAVMMSQPVLLEHFIAPLMRTIGELWRDGSLGIAQEHLATSIVRTFLGNMIKNLQIDRSASTIVFTTPAGQHHEIGALLAAAAAASEGWRVTYLGPNMPAAEIANAARLNEAVAVGLSIIHPINDPNIGNELLQLREILPDHIHIIIGGSGATEFSSQIQEIQAHQIANINHFRQLLDTLKSE